MRRGPESESGVAVFDRIVLSCEHAANRIPVEYAHLFGSAAAVLEGHRAYDAGALEVARFLAVNLAAPLFSGSASRLLVDLNRSTSHPRLFSEYVRGFESAEKTRILEGHYHPYRRQVEEALRSAIHRYRVLHLSIHSFTPELDGKVRRADVGLLYDPGRSIERQACTRILDRIPGVDSTLAVRRNYPYRGTDDGFTTHLRSALRSDRYAGIEIELNQARIASVRARRQLGTVLENAIREELNSNPRRAR